jgi:hypothetical protein
LNFQALIACLAFACAGAVHAAASDSGSAASLRAEYAALRAQIGDNQFQRPIHLVSTQLQDRLEADLYALVDYPIAAVSAALGVPANWCEVLILHINTKYCRASSDQPATVLAVRIGGKTDQALDSAYLLEFATRIDAATPYYLQVQLDADKGPLATRDYRIVLKAVSVEDGRSFLHLSYSYAYGLAGRLALQAYLATAGRGKVGFTVTGKQPNGEPEYIGNVRGLVERNTMRYYLAIDAYLGALATPAPAQLEKRLQSWFAATEKFPRQLHDVDATAYLEMKRREYLRQQTR